jgi:hypothetical protein
MPWRLPVRIAASVSLVTALKRKAPSSAANTAPKAKASAAYAIGCNWLQKGQTKHFFHLPFDTRVLHSNDPWPREKLKNTINEEGRHRCPPTITPK